MYQAFNKKVSDRKYQYLLPKVNNLEDVFWNNMWEAMSTSRRIRTARPAGVLAHLSLFAGYNVMDETTASKAAVSALCLLLAVIRV